MKVGSQSAHAESNGASQHTLLRLRASRAFVTGILLMAGLISFGTPTSGQLSHFTRRTWGVSDGLPEPIVQVLGQDRDGFLLVGTSGGLRRFDGARFIPVPDESSADTSPFPIYCLTVARDGSVWAGTEGAGLLHLTGKQLRRYGAESGLADPFVRGVIEDAHGRIWAGTDNGLFVNDGSGFRRVDNASSGAPLAVAAITMDDRHRIWVGGSDLVVVDGDQLQKVALPGTYSKNRVKSLLQATDGTIWVGTVGGLLKRTRGQFHSVPGITATVRSLTQTRDGTIWIGTIGEGIWNERDGALRRIDHDNLLPSGTVLTIFQDSDLRVWVGTQSGLVRLESTSVQVVPLPGGVEADYGTISPAGDGTNWMVVQNLFRVSAQNAQRVKEPGLPKSGLRCVFTARDGSMWVGTDGVGAYHRDLSGHVTHLLAPKDLPNNFVRVFLEASDGSIWIGTDQGLAKISRYSAPSQYTVANGLAQFSIRDLLEDRTGDIWIGTDKGLSLWHRGSFVQNVVTETLKDEKVWSILEDRRKTLWFGTRDHGLYRYRDGTVSQFTAAQGLPSNSIYKILQNHRGTFWISGPSSISSISEEALDGVSPAQIRIAARQYRMPFEADGAQVYGGRQSAGFVANDDTVWFPTNRGAAHVHFVNEDTVSIPKISIRSISQDGQSLPERDRMTISAGTTHLDFNYAPLFLGSQHGIRFAYKLEPFDTDWVQAGTAQTASYTNLPPGTFRFRVVAFDSSRPESRTEASMLLVKQHFYYQTWWFRCACLLLALTLAFVGYRVRVQRIKTEFDATLKERGRIAREMHDTVIQGCTGISVLLEALASQHVSALEGNTLFEHARQQIVTTVDEARDMVWNLRHAEKVNLASSLEALARQASQAFGIHVTYTGSEQPGMVSHLAGHEVLMIAREALANSASHAEPEAITMTLSSDAEGWRLDIDDNGKGFQTATSGAARRHYGVTGMRERARRIGATLHLSSVTGMGTKVCLQFSQKDLLRTSPVKERV